MPDWPTFQLVSRAYRFRDDGLVKRAATDCVVFLMHGPFQGTDNVDVRSDADHPLS